jgi:hypothetical protein
MSKFHYVWREAYINAVLETNSDLKSVRICDALAAIEQRRLIPVETEDERRELENALGGVRALISECDLRVV